MQNWKKRVLSVILALCIIAGLLPAASVQAAEQLVNVAPEGTASTEDGSYGTHVIGNVIDGDINTNWQTQGVWPSTAVVQLDMGRSISEVAVRLGGDDMASRTVTVTVEYAQNGVVSDLIAFGSQTVTLTGDMTARFTLEQPVSATHFFVTLSDPRQNGAAGAFWPCVSEIEIYEKQEQSLSDYGNIASQAVITATGGREHPTEGSANLVDGSTSTLYKFYNAAQTSEQAITLAFEQPRAMDAFAIAFEHVGAYDSIDFAFRYSILARNGSGSYDTIVDNAAANRTDNSQQQYSFLEKTYSEVKLVMHSCTTYGGSNAGWPAVAEFEIYGSEAAVADDCISNGKSVHASSGQSLAKNITDGSKNSAWRGSYYPGYVDIDLGANYNLDAVEVYTPANGYSQYTIYTSLDGRDFAKLAEKTSRASATLDQGERYAADGVEARIVRVYLEYNSAETAAVINEVRVLGTPSGTPVQTLPAIDVADFEDSEYADLTVTAEDTYAEVYGIIERRLGEQYKSWFTLELADGGEYDYFELSTEGGKVHVKGNDGVSLATGINHYLKYYCDVHISQVGDQVTMPYSAPAIEGTVRRETKAKVRYSYNYCTLSYSMAFWGQEEWRNELDWLALNGVNVVLDATAQEEVWRRFLGELGYTHQEAKDYIAGPAYYAWAYMANLSGFGGPVHDSWFEERTELARKNQKIMRALGMQPVLQGYSGMVPTDITAKATGSYALSSGDIIAQGSWCSFQRPAMLRTTSAAFDVYAELFYRCQREVYGDTSDYYATDPFHEGGNTGGMNARDISREVLTSMLASDEDAVWIIQAWQGNPTTALLNGLDDVQNGAQHALVLDLYAEKTPHNQETGSSYGDTREFDDTPWLYCMLNNFGGRLGLHGHLDSLAKNIPIAFNSCKHIAGIGITPEASVNNPVLYDFLFETIWQEDASQPLHQIDLDTWLDAYAERRYGAASESANAAWDILKDTVYKASLNNLGQGAPESVVNARPALSISAASTWGNAVVSYDKVQLEKAAALLLEDYETLKNSEAYLYDVANVLQQVLSNSAQEYQKKMAAAYSSRDLASFEKYSALFLEIIDHMETVTATSEYFLLGRWVEQAKALGRNADDFTRELYEFNAKALVTTWGSYNQAESGGLKDYSNRQWSGLIGDFYKVRWERWINARNNELKGEAYESNINWFQWEWEWVRSNTVYTTTATPADLKTLGHEILEKFTAANPAADASRDIDPGTMTVYAEHFQPNNATEGDPNYVLDGNPATFWHTVWRDSDRSTHYLIFTFSEITKIDGMRILQRPSGPNGVITKFDLLVRTSETEDWTTVVDDGTLTSDTSWQMVTFDAVDALQVKLQVVDATSGEVGNKFAAAAEVRFTMPAETHAHSYEAVVTAPTCTEPGFTTYTCECGDSYIADETEALGHEWKGTGCTRCDEKRENPFTDVPEDSFYIDPVLWAVEKGVTTGATPTTFNPGGVCMRGHVVTFLWRAMGSPEPETDVNPFADVKEADYFYKDVLWAYEKGITTGTDAAHFAPTGQCNRAQVVTFLWRAMNQPESSAEVTFTDVQPGQFYSDAVAWAVEKGITNGMGDGTFGVNTTCNRAQVVTFLYRTFNN
ncbi:MAG: alpha-N-acetylglucosaminidase C-terminal domain-containing protein [Oscillospiraceae bacterium]|nr:alpha-N-acetylglucosaminidase C-terminal domain-containing protein [Oscillospiraceae bacterium]